MAQGYSEEEVNRLEAFFSALKKESALQIFQKLENPFTSGKEEIKKLGLTERKYYRRLRELVDTGLVKRRGDNTYELSYVGCSKINNKFCHHSSDLSQSTISVSKVLSNEVRGIKNGLFRREKRNCLKSLQGRKKQ